MFAKVKSMAEWPSGYGRQVHLSLDSTLSEAARQAGELAGPTWILALEQTAARGRRGRPWATPKGNFAATLIMPRTEPPGVAGLRSFVASLALLQGFVAVTGREQDFALKWPNDVLLRGGKIAGILLESVGEHLAIGIGVNLAHAPDPDMLEAGALRPVTLNSETGVTVSAEAFLDEIAAAYAKLEDQFLSHGFAPIRHLWLAHAARRGEVIRARSMRDETSGVFEDVDNDGNLILATAQGRVAITAADVFFD